MADEPKRITIGEVRVSFVNCLTAKQNENGEDIYDITFLLSKDDPKHQEIRKQLLALASAAVANKWPNKESRPAKLISPVKDGDSGDDTNDGLPKARRYKEFTNCWYVTASSRYKPGIVDQKVQPVSDLAAKDKLYAGCYVNLQVHAYAFSNKKHGASIGLDNIQLVRDGERFGGTGAPDPKSAFAPLDGADAFGGTSTEDTDDMFS